ncbi:MAG: site-2 protease family protein [Gammaproteobacteria bacterium]|nr:MAG: site-2 protease family protein [Gammaproteobacteria bacterium]
MEELTTVQKLIVWIPPVLLAITLHEVAHGWVASLLGDPTARLEGRLTLNPLRHVDPVGTVLVPLLTFFTAGFVFGWAKPVPVDWRRLRNPRRDMGLVAAAGPLSNLLMLAGWALLMKLAASAGQGLIWLALPLIYMGVAGIIINAILALINLIPVPPLDGSRVVSALLPPPWARVYNRLEPYGLVILLVLLVSGGLDRIFGPLLGWIQDLAARFIGA